jgi:hypothetical protein
MVLQQIAANIPMKLRKNQRYPDDLPPRFKSGYF